MRIKNKMEGEKERRNKKLALFAIGAVVVGGVVYLLSKLKRKKLTKKCVLFFNYDSDLERKKEEIKFEFCGDISLGTSFFLGSAVESYFSLLKDCGKENISIGEISEKEESIVVIPNKEAKIEDFSPQTWFLVHVSENERCSLFINSNVKDTEKVSRQISNLINKKVKTDLKVQLEKRAPTCFEDSALFVMVIAKYLFFSKVIFLNNPSLFY